MKALRTFSPHILGSIRYVGLDPDQGAVEAARAIATEVDRSIPRTTPLVETMAECRVGPLSDFATLRRNSFDIVHVVNVLHHLVELDDLDKFFHRTMSCLKMGGYLIIEDFFFGNYPVNLDWDRYLMCKGAVFWGPAELGAILFLITRELGSYRFHKRDSVQRSNAPASDPKCYFGYTYVLRRIDPTEGLPYALLDRGYHYALQRMLAKVNAAATSGAPGYAAYAGILRPLLGMAAQSIYVPWPRHRKDPLRQKLRWLYDSEDPFPRRYWT